MSASFSSGVHKHSTTSKQELPLPTPPSYATQLITHRGRYGSRFECWWPHYYNLMVYVSEEAMFLSLSLFPSLPAESCVLLLSGQTCCRSQPAVH